MLTKRFAIFAATAAVAGALAEGTAAKAEVMLTAMTALPKNLSISESFLVNFIPRLNNAGKGVLQVRYLGGPEITPPRKAASALKRGVFDILQSPTSYYLGMVPEGYTFTLAERTPAELRANGGFALLQKIWAEKAGARLLAWSESATRYNTFLTVEPKFDSQGNLSLKGIKMRVTGTYRPLFNSLGATTVGIKHTEIYTGLQRGVIQGFGWPDVGYTGLGVHKLAKFRIDPQFYKANMGVTVNLEKWNALSRAGKEILEKAALEYEQVSVEYMEGHRKREEQLAFDAGMKVITLKGSAAAHYLNAANSAVWKRLKEQSEYAEQIKKLAFPDIEG